MTRTFPPHLAPPAWRPLRVAGGEGAEGPGIGSAQAGWSGPHVLGVGRVGTEQSMVEGYSLSLRVAMFLALRGALHKVKPGSDNAGNAGVSVRSARPGAVLSAVGA